MNQKEILALGIIAAFVFTTVISVKPADARDEDGITQTGSRPEINIEVNTDVNADTVIQLAINTAIVAGSRDDNSAVAESSQETWR